MLVPEWPASRVRPPYSFCQPGGALSGQHQAVMGILPAYTQSEYGAKALADSMAHVNMLGFPGEDDQH